MHRAKISKKELLEQTGISYGQLYRWKRERLIPEEWFIKQSSFTGQETYFPKEQVLARVHAILEKKDSCSLDKMAKLFSPEPGSSIAASNLARFDGINQELLTRLQKNPDACESYQTGEAVYLTALSALIGKDGFGVEAATKLAASSLEIARDQATSASTALLFSGGGNDNDGNGGSNDSYHVVFCPGTSAPLFDSEINVIGTLPLSESAELLGGFISKISQ